MDEFFPPDKFFEPNDPYYPYGGFAAVQAATESRRPRLSPPTLSQDGFSDGHVIVESGVGHYVFAGYSLTDFDPNTHPGVDIIYRALWEEEKLGRSIELGPQDLETGLWYIGIRDLTLLPIDSEGNLAAFHLPHVDFADFFWGEAHVFGTEEGKMDIVVVPHRQF